LRLFRRAELEALQLVITQLEPCFVLVDQLAAVEDKRQ